MDGWLDITLDELKAAAKSGGFDMVLPLLVRRLIAETNAGLTELDMPGGSGVAAGGYDGVVSTTLGSTNVPEGPSVWELSVSLGNRKVDTDYSKRHDGPHGEPANTVTYVQVILQPWTKARDWASSRTSEGTWREVRGYNLSRIHQWLDDAPATLVWLAERLGKTTPGARSLGAWWSDTWLPSTRVPLTADAVLAGRTKTAEALIARLKDGARVTSLGGDLRADEARAFVAAALDQNGSLDGSHFGARAMAVSDERTMARLGALSQPLVVLLDDPRLARDLPAGHPHQLVYAVRPGRSADLDVPPVHRDPLAAALVSAGVEQAEARRLGPLGRRSLLAVRRALATNPDAFTPRWADDPDRLKRRLLLAGSWSDKSDSDRDVIAKLTGRPYDEVVEECRRLAADQQTPLVSLVDGIWHVVAVEDAWSLLAGELTRDDLAAARAVILDVLGETNPLLSVPDEDQGVAQFKGVGLSHSASLRGGLASTLVAASAPSVGEGAGLTGWSAGIVRELLEEADSDQTYQLWASLADVLTLLAEAAPDIFLRQLKRGLAADVVDHRSMFTDEQDAGLGFGISSPHSSFLWALETVAWSPDHFDDAVDVLADLASIDPGGRLSNRPIASLAGLFSVWLPMTEADLDQRVRTLNRLTTTHPAVAQELLVKALPDAVHNYQSDHAHPRFRDWGAGPRQIRHSDRDAMVSHVNELIIESLDRSTEYFGLVIDRFDDLAPAHRTLVANKLEAAAVTLTDDHRHELHEALRKQISRHRQFPDADWSLSAVELESLDRALAALTPADPVSKHAWIFESAWIRFEGIDRRDLEAYRAELQSRQAAALAEVIDELGLDGAVTLARGTQSPRLVGQALHAYGTDYDTIALDWLATRDVTLANVAEGYLSTRVENEPDSYVDTLVSATNSDLAKARILLTVHDLAVAGTKLDALDREVKKLYWAEFDLYRVSDEASDVETARALIELGERPAAALMLFALRTDDTSTAEVAEVVAQAFEALLKSGQPGPEFDQVRHWLPQLFGILAAHQDTVGVQRCITLEWLVQPAFEFEARTPNLEAAIVADPAFFVELVCTIFKPASDEEVADTAEPDPAQEGARGRMVGQAFEVLRNFNGLPGLAADGTVDAEYLTAWVRKARVLCAAADREVVGDHQIGDVLANAPAGADGGTIHESVRNLLEDVRSDDLLDGISMGINNKDGFTWRGLLDGGDQERVTAASFREEAERSSAWPQTRKLLNDLADSAERWGQVHDARAERTHRDLER